MKHQVPPFTLTWNFDLIIIKNTEDETSVVSNHRRGPPDNSISPGSLGYQVLEGGSDGFRID